MASYLNISEIEQRISMKSMVFDWPACNAELIFQFLLILKNVNNIKLDDERWDEMG